MNIGPIARFCGGYGVEEVVRSVFYLLLAALIAVDLTRTAFNASRFFRAPDVLAGVSPLDSFSEPATAAAILKRQAESLLFDYTEARNSASEVALSRIHDPRQAGNHRSSTLRCGFTFDTTAESVA